MATFDYVIVGAGAAGCVLANRLSEDPRVNVALIEEGPNRNHRKPIVRTPLAMVTFMAPALSFLGGPRFVTWYATGREPGLADRTIAMPRGRGVGGCTNINGQVFIRGNARDYDDWRDMGNAGWGYEDMLPYFRRLETFEPLAAGGRYDDRLHGTGGPLNVAALRSENPLGALFLDAAAQVGIPLNDDFNGTTQFGAGRYMFTQRDGERVTAEGAYLEPARHRHNLTVFADRRVTALTMDGTRATGVTWETEGGGGHLAAREVILSAGSFASPHLLMLSGIGDGDSLRRHGVEVRHHLPGVGQNLQDHFDVTLEYRASTDVPYGISWRALPRNVMHVLNWLTRRRGLFATTTAEGGAFVASSQSDGRPDIQLYYCSGRANTQSASGFSGHGMLLHVCQLSSPRTGSVDLVSSDPHDLPTVRYGAYLESDDLIPLREGVRLARRIASQPMLAAHIAEEVAPGTGSVTDADIDAFIRSSASTLFHPVGTCAMGIDGQAVVDPASLRVRGVEGLRVIDASVMPKIVSGNTVAATYCVAEKGADLVRQSDASSRRA